MRPVFRKISNGRFVYSEGDPGNFWNHTVEADIRVEVTDREGNYIFENDIVELDWPCGWDQNKDRPVYERVKGIVYWDGFALMWRSERGSVDYFDPDENALIMGNVYNNEEIAEEIEDAYTPF